ncbi:hypothetical protein BGX31_005712, partial [Mortierella sp. GBA43]
MAKATGRFVDDLSILLSIIDALILYPYMFEGSGSMKISEMDVHATLWHPILSRLFATSSSKARVKIGETTMPRANQEKREQYEDEKAIAFKVDARVIIDHRNEEIDLAVVEVAKGTEGGKFCSNGGKLLREAKVITNLLAKILPDSPTFLKDTTSYGIQLCGTSGSIFSLHLVAPTLYVAVCEAGLELPTSVADLEQFGETLKAMYWFRDTINDKALL